MDFPFGMVPSLGEIVPSRFLPSRLAEKSMAFSRSKVRAGEVDVTPWMKTCQKATRDVPLINQNRRYGVAPVDHVYTTDGRFFLRP